MYTPKTDYIIGIDPGPEKSGWAVLCVYEPNKFSVEFGSSENSEVLEQIKRLAHSSCFAYEQVRSYGNAAGNSMYDTAHWSGRFEQAYLTASRIGVVHPLPRKTVVTHLCGNPKANDGNVRRRVLDIYTELAKGCPEVLDLGGGAEPIIGTAKKPGALYGLSSHAIPALAVALTAAEKFYGKELPS